MKLEFESILKGNDISIVGHKIKDNQSIKSLECKINWFIDPVGGTYGIKYWNCKIESFEVEMVLTDIDTMEDEIVKFDSYHLDYKKNIDLDNYKMTNDFIITEVEINKIDKTVVACINKNIE